jgi:prepilin-type N-terminal cleavage/methylation domain-containing protein
LIVNFFVRPVTRSQNHSASSGYSLIELSIALSILAVIIVGSLIGVQKILRTNAVNNELKAMPETMASAQRLTSNLATLAGLNTGVFTSLGVWPQDRVVGGADGAAATVSNHFGGRQFLNPNNAALAGYDPSQLFVLTLTNIPTEACADLVSGMDRMALGLYVGANITADPGGGVAGDVVKNPGSDSAAGARSANLATLAGRCGAAGGGRIRLDMVVAR